MVTEEENQGNAEQLEFMYSDEKLIDKYRGYIQVGDRIVANSELRLLQDKSSYNLDSHNMWYVLSDFYVEPCYKRKGFEKRLVLGITNFARERKINVVKKVKVMNRLEELLNPVMQALILSGFKRFDDETVYFSHDGGIVQNE